MDFWHKGLFPFRLRVALRGERNRNTIGVSIGPNLSPRNATPAVTEIRLNWTLQQQQNEHQVKPDSFVLYNRRLYHNFTNE